MLQAGTNNAGRLKNTVELRRETSSIADVIPSPTAAADLVRLSSLSPMAVRALEQLGDALYENLKSGKASEIDGRFTLPLEIEISPRKLMILGTQTNDIEIQGAIHQSWDYFIATLRERGFVVNPKSHNGAYTIRKATISWSHEEGQDHGVPASTDLLLSPSTATNLVRESNLDTMAKKAFKQMGDAFQAHLMEKKVPIIDGDFVMPLEVSIDTSQLYTPGQWANDIEKQGAISRSWDYFLTTLRDKGFIVEPESHNGAYTTCKAKVSWSQSKEI